jgi:hypothetical protein
LARRADTGGRSGFARRLVVLLMTTTRRVRGASSRGIVYVQRTLK